MIIIKENGDKTIKAREDELNKLKLIIKILLARNPFEQKLNFDSIQGIEALKEENDKKLEISYDNFNDNIDNLEDKETLKIKQLFMYQGYKIYKTSKANLALKQNKVAYYKTLMADLFGAMKSCDFFNVILTNIKNYGKSIIDKASVAFENFRSSELGRHKEYFYVLITFISVSILKIAVKNFNLFIKRDFEGTSP